MRAGLIAQWGEISSPACPPLTLQPQDDWTPVAPEYVGRHEVRTYLVTPQIGDNTPDSPCQPNPQSLPTARARRLECPNPFTEWNDEHAACVNEDFVATITTEASEEEDCAEVGNPCNVKTGEKYETEVDFDLGWVALTRHYHSGISMTSGGFGYGWSHSLGAKLVVSGPATVGIIEGSGYQRPFRAMGSTSEATDGSGDRLVSSGGWKLYTSNRILTFDGDGRAYVQFNPDGTSLTYAYDSRARLSTVTQNTGRSIAFQYQSNAYNALIESVTLAGTPLVTYTYSPNGQVKTATYPQSGTRTYHYDDSRFRYHLTGITAEDNQRYSTFAYDAKGRVTSSTHDGGADAVSLVYLSQGGAVVTDALDHETTYALTPGGPADPSRKVTSLTDSRGSITRTYYPQSVDFRRRLDIITDRNGTQTKHLYAEMPDPVTGQASRVDTVKEAFGLPEERVSEQRWDLASNRLLASRVADREVRYGYNARVQPAQVAVKDLLTGDVRNTTMLYCEASDVAVAGSTCPIEGLVKSIDGPRTDVSDVTAYTYYPADHASCATAPSACAYRRGDLWKVTNPAGHVSEILAYDAAGRATSIKDANGVVTELEYHPRGWPTVRQVRGATAAADVVESVEYWPTGLVRKVTDPDGVAVSFGYDAAQRLRTVADDAGNTITYDLDDAGNRLQEDVKDSAGVLKKTLSRIFNTLGQMTTLKDAGSHPTGFTYDVDGNPELQTDALLRVADRDHDPLNRLKRMVQDVGGIEAETGVAYDDLDNTTKVTDPKGLETNYTYNGFGDLLELESPDTGTTASTYDSAGNLKTRTDARGVTRTHSYDALNRPTGIAYAESIFNVAYVYDVQPSACQAEENFAVGRLAQMTDRSGSTHFCYDRIGRLVRKVQVTNGITFTVRYAYTKAVASMP